MRPLRIILLFGIFTGCNVDTLGQNELIVLNQTFIELVGTEWYYEPLPPPPIPLCEESTRDDSLRFEEDTSQCGKLLGNRQLDTSVLKIYLYDTLTTYKANDFLEGVLSQNNFEANFPVDTTWITLIRKLNRIGEPKALDVNQVTETGNYTLVSKSEFNDTTDSKRRIGIMTMSRVAFSPDNKRGVFYYDFTCGGLCGWGSLVFIEKQEGAWRIVGERQMWVS